MLMKRCMLSASLLSVGSLCTVPIWGQAERPNIVLVMVDDLGLNDLGVTGTDFYETPNIDRLATEGLLFSQAYAAAPNSAPSRACYMTGMYTPRHGVYTVAPAERGNKKKRKFIPPVTNEDVAADFVTMAEALKQEGYVCAHIGKWHLGEDSDGRGPLSQGFEVNVAGGHAGGPYSYFYPYCNKRGKCYVGLEEGKEGEYLTDRLTQEAIGFIEGNQLKPFFLHLAHYGVHVPLNAPQHLIEKYKNKAKGRYHTNPVYAAMIENLDWNVGRLCQAIDSLGLSKRTLIVFASDNGGSEPVTDNYQVRGGKGMPYEGGTRIPLIMKWSGHIKPGTKTDMPVIGEDLYPTFVTLAGGVPKENLDGQDIFSLLENPNEQRALYWHFPAYLQANGELRKKQPFRATPYSSMRFGEWKLIYFYETYSVELYNLKSDPKEKTNVATRYPDKASELKKQLLEWVDKTYAAIPSKFNPEYVGSK